MKFVKGLESVFPSNGVIKQLKKVLPTILIIRKNGSAPLRHTPVFYQRESPDGLKRENPGGPI